VTAPLRFLHNIPRNSANDTHLQHFLRDAAASTDRIGFAAVGEDEAWKTKIYCTVSVVIDYTPVAGTHGGMVH
jgi:hypothetical protein